MGTVRTIKIEESVFADNASSAGAIRSMLTDKKTTMINVMSSPGSGKTTLLTALVNKLKAEMTIRVMDVDIESTLDAQRVADATGVEALQIHNGGLCHIDADMVTRALSEFAPEGSGVLEETDLSKSSHSHLSIRSFRYDLLVSPAPHSRYGTLGTAKIGHFF